MKVLNRPTDINQDDISGMKKIEVANIVYSRIIALASVSSDRAAMNESRFYH